MAAENPRVGVPAGDVEHIPKHTGVLWFVDKNGGSDSNTGLSPAQAFETIGAAITASSAGDAITVKQGTYTEVGIDLSKDGLELWIEIGTIIDPASGTALTVSGNYCKIRSDKGSLFITPAASQCGVCVTGNNSYIHDIRVNAASSANLGFDLQGNGAVLTNCRCADPLTAGFKIQGDKVKLEKCGTGGQPGDSSIGYWFTNTCDLAWAKECNSRGHETAGYQVDTGCTRGSIDDCSSGAGDGRWSDADNAFTWPGFTFDDNIFKSTPFAGAPTTYNIFKITGAVRIKNIFGHVETVIPNTACSIHLESYSTGGTADITNAPGPNIQNFVAGAMVVRNSPSNVDIDTGNPSGTPVVIENTNFRQPDAAVDVVADNGATTYIRAVLSAALASGEIHCHAHWEPLTDDGFMEPA